MTAGEDGRESLALGKDGLVGCNSRENIPESEYFSYVCFACALSEKLTQAEDRRDKTGR